MMSAPDSLPQAEIFTDPSEPALAKSWREIQESAVRMDPFGTSWWAQASQQHSAETEPCITVLRDISGPIAIATFGLTRTAKGTRLTAYASRHRDLFDMMARVDSAAAAEALCAAIPWHRIRDVRLSGIPADSPLGPALYSCGTRNGLSGVMYSNNGAPELSLLDERGVRYPDYKAILRGKTSKQLRSRMARLGDVRYTTASHKDQIPPLLDALSWLHQKRWYATPFPSFFTRGESRQLMSEIAQAAFDAGALHLSVLFVDQRPAAAAMGYVVATTYYYHCVAHNPDFWSSSPGRTLMSYILDDLLQDGRASNFSYLIGEEAYKLAHVTRTRPVCRLEMVRSCSRATVLRLGAFGEKTIRRSPKLLALTRRIKHFLQRRRHAIHCHVRRLAGYYNSLPTAVFVGKAAGRIAELFYERRRMVAMRLSVLNEVNAACDVHVRAGSLDDFNRLTEMRYGFLDPSQVGCFFERWRQGMRYYVACIDGNPVSSVWVQLGMPYTPPELHYELTVSSDPVQDGLIIDVWADPHMRGRRIYPKLVQEVMARMLAEEACGRFMVAIDMRNQPSIRAHEHVGFRPVQELEVTRLFGRTIAKKAQPIQGEA